MIKDKIIHNIKHINNKLKNYAKILKHDKNQVDYLHIINLNIHKFNIII